MNINVEKMGEYGEFLDETSKSITKLCTQIQEGLLVAVQCMDEKSGRIAAAKMARNMENIKKAIAPAEDAKKRLILAKKYIIDSGNTFGR